MTRISMVLCICFAFIISCKSNTNQTEKNAITKTNLELNEQDSEEKSEVQITPITHGTLVLEYNGVVVYVDPTGGLYAFDGQNAPDIILITDIHGDHLNIETLEQLQASNPKIIAPKAVADQLPQSLKSNLSVLPNFQTIEIQVKNNKIGIEAIPMYNLREEALHFHAKGRGNGYVLMLGDERVYISGDTEDIPEMRALKNIDIAFVCMNLPYTMPVQSAADAVLEFKPKRVYPYHYRGTEGLSDVNLFKTLVNTGDSTINVIQLEWYKAP